MITTASSMSLRPVATSRMLRTALVALSVVPVLLARVDSASAQSAATNASFTPAARVPDALVGRWQFGTISTLNFYEKGTGRWLDNAGGVGVFFTFTPDGRYTQGVLIKSTMYSCTTQVWIYNEGTVVFEQSTFRVYPTSGRVRSQDNCNQRYNFDRPDDLQRKQGDLYSWAFERNANDGKTYLMIGVKGDMVNRSSFRPAQ